MVDIRGEWDNSIQKFCLVADLVTYLVGVSEKSPSDFLVEQSLLVGTVEYFAKSHVRKREYDAEEEEHPFGWMQDGVLACSKTKADSVGGELKRISSTSAKNFRRVQSRPLSCLGWRRSPLQRRRWVPWERYSRRR
jgi:hypothetical protein